MSSARIATTTRFAVVSFLLLAGSCFAYEQPAIQNSERGTVAVIPVGSDRQIIEFIGPDAAEIAPSSISSEARTDLGIRIQTDPISIIRATADRTSLTAIRLNGVPIDHQTIVTIGECCPHLRSLVLCGVQVLPSDELTDLTIGERQSLGSSQLTEETIGLLAGLDELRYLVLDGIELSSGAISRLSDLSKLEALAIANVNVSDNALETIGKLANLEVLSLRGTRVSGRGLGHLVQCEHLESLDLRNTPIDGSIVEFFPRALGLRELDVAGCELDDTVLKALGEALPFTNIDRTPNVDALVPEWLTDTQAIRRYRAASSRLMMQYPHDRVLRFGETEGGVCVGAVVFPRDRRVEDWSLVYVGWIVSVSHLELRGTSITDDGLSNLAPLSRLEVLDLASTGIGDEGIEHLRTLRRLRALDLSQTSVTNDGLQVVSELPELEMLLLNFTEVSNAGVEKLARLTPLRTLALRGCGLTDACADALTGIELKAIDLRDTAISADVLQQIRRSNPETYVLMSNGTDEER